MYNFFGIHYFWDKMLTRIKEKLPKQKWVVRGISNVVEPIKNDKELKRYQENSFSSVHYFYLMALITAYMNKKMATNSDDR